MEYQEVLRTELQRGRLDAVKEKRTKRIKEAIDWKGGTQADPKKQLITTLENGLEVYFLKPGKEVENIARPNSHDMTPMVGSSENRLRFDEIWSYLSKISMVDFETFKAVLVLIYRDAYLLDHVEVDGKIRYWPRGDVALCIKELEGKIGGIIPFGLMGLLHFLDLLGWNEDVKYHVEDDVPTFDGKYGFKVGRINTLLSCIRVPYQTSDFVKHVLDKCDDRKNIDFMLGYQTMQQLAKSRGTCTPTNGQLIEWLSPYIVR